MARLRTDKDGTIRTRISDIESDDINCAFNNDGCVELDTKDFSYITLSINNLYELINLIESAEKKYKKMHEKTDDLN